MPFLRQLQRRFTTPQTPCALLFFSMLGNAGPFRAQVPVRFPVTRERVLLAMQGRDWPMTGVQIHLAAPVTATVAEPVLEIDAVTPRPGHEAMLRMACQLHTECLPFLVLALWPAEAPMPDLLPKRERISESASSGQETLETRAVGSPQLLARGFPTAAAPAPTVIRAGSPATLLLEGKRTHIRLHVVFAQSGHVGDTVRVTTTDRRQVYVAEVLSPGLLKGEL